MIGQSNNAFSILGSSLAGKGRVHVLIIFHPLAYNKHFSRSYENRSIADSKVYYAKQAPFFIVVYAPIKSKSISGGLITLVQNGIKISYLTHFFQ